MTQQDFSKVLNEQEMNAVQYFQENEILREAVKKVLLYGVYHNGTLEAGKPANPLQNFLMGLVLNAEELQLTNEQLGQKTKEAVAGVNMIERAFQFAFPLFKKETVLGKKDKNPAR